SSGTVVSPAPGPNGYRWAGVWKIWPDTAADSKTVSTSKAQLEPGRNMFDLIDVYVVIDHIYLFVCITKH
ncbi:hypothetical protein LSAT2_010945, partial [Lamellibrachia satsuma]